MKMRLGDLKQWVMENKANYIGYETSNGTLAGVQYKNIESDVKDFGEEEVVEIRRYKKIVDVFLVP